MRPDARRSEVELPLHIALAEREHTKCVDL